MPNGPELGVDDPAIARLLEELYEVISFEEGDEPNWDGLHALFSEHARITRITPGRPLLKVAGGETEAL